MDGWHGYSRVILERVIISKKDKSKLENHAEDKKPFESCALLFGNKIGSDWIIEEIFIAENIDKSNVHFTISAEQTIEAYKKAEESGKQIISVFHSHPDSQARPSETDRKYMEMNPYPWIIYSGITKEMNAFLLGNEIAQIEIISK